MGLSRVMALGTVAVKENPWEDWFYVVGPFLFYLAVVYILTAFGRTEKKDLIPHFFGRISDSLRRATGLPGWSMAGVLTGLLVLLVAAIGLYWDVAWHIDLGRDKLLLNPSHMMIVLGLGGLMFAGAIATTFATLDGAKVGLKYKKITIPWSAMALFAMGLGGIASFPFDELWHRAYGLDVTLWSPTHLQLLAGGGLATIPIWLMVAEGMRESKPTAVGRFIQIMAAGACLTGLTIFQGEFDFRVPQFQMVYYPVLVMIAAGVALTWARLSMGRGGAFKTVLFYIGVRGFLYLLVTVALNHSFAHFPTYIVPALAVEAVARIVGTQNRVRFALASGAAIGTVGLAAELFWMPLSNWYPLSPALLPKAFALGLPAAMAAALVGARLARPFSEDKERSTVGTSWLAGAAVVIVAALAFPLPRQANGDVTATVALEKVGNGDVARATVTLDPPDAARNATLFGIGSNQGGGTVSSALIEKSPGVYESAELIPIVGKWKSQVGLQRGNEVMSAPIYLPADPEIGASEVAALPVRTQTFDVVTKVLLREAHAGPLWPSIVAYTEVLAVTVFWVALIGLAERRISAGRTDTVSTSPFRKGVLGYNRV
ncbi:MAG: hypothetical protein ACT4OM_00230 [Actinomycetota bacterium]